MDFDLKEVTEDPETEALLEAVSTTGGCRLLNVFVLGSDLVLTSTFDEAQMYVLMKCRPGTQFYVLPQTFRPPKKIYIHLYLISDKIFAVLVGSIRNHYLNFPSKFI